MHVGENGSELKLASPGEVKLGGVVSALKLKNTKKGERYGNFNLEDKTGFIEVIVWPDVYKKCMDLLGSDEVFLTNSSWGVLPVTAVERQQIGNGAPGALTRRLRDAWLDLVEEETAFEAASD